MSFIDNTAYSIVIARIVLKTDFTNEGGKIMRSICSLISQKCAQLANVHYSTESVII